MTESAETAASNAVRSGLRLVRRAIPAANSESERDNCMSELNARISSPRRALLDLAPLELDCMNTLWPMGEGTRARNSRSAWPRGVRAPTPRS